MPPRDGNSELPANALVFVRNTVTHDARVLRTAATIRREGLEPLVVGVTSTTEPTAHEHIAGVEVLRLSPQSPFARVRRQLRRGRMSAPGAPSKAAPSRATRLPAPLLALHRILTTLDFYRQGFALVNRVRPDLVHCNDFNTMWIGVAARFRGASIVYDSHELWADRNGRREPRWWIVLWEALFVRVANAVVTTSPAYAVELARRYRIHRPTLVRNVPDANGARPQPRPASGRIVYVGGVMPGRGLEVAVKALVDARNVRLEVIGPGRPDYRAGIAALAAELGVDDRFALRDPVPPSAVIDVLGGAAAGLALIEPICLSYRLTLPNKLFEYLVAGVPVIASRLPAIEEVVTQTGAGVLADPADPHSVAEAMETAVERSQELSRLAIQAATRFSAEHEAAELMRVHRDALRA
jgi:glycosyltransferase involved in cell wall biosynthesis